MADYIKKNILVQAYVHLDLSLDKYPGSELIESIAYLEEYAIARSQAFLGIETDVDVGIENGSIKSKITVLGTIAALYTGVVQYPDFRTGILLIHSDAKRLVEMINSESMYKFGARSKNSIRIESRVGVIGSLQKIVSKLDSIRLHSPNADINSTNRALEDVATDIGKLISALQNEEDIVISLSGFLSIAETIPQQPRPPLRGSHPLNDIAIYETRRRDLIARINRDLSVARNLVLHRNDR